MSEQDLNPSVLTLFTASLFFSVALGAMEDNWHRVRQEIAGNMAEAVFDVVFPPMHDSVCDNADSRACSITEQIWYYVKLTTAVAWFESVGATIIAAIVKVKRETYFFEDLRDNSWQAFCFVCSLPIIAIEAIIDLVRMLRGDKDDLVYG